MASVLVCFTSPQSVYPSTCLSADLFFGLCPLVFRWLCGCVSARVCVSQRVPRVAQEEAEAPAATADTTAIDVESEVEDSDGEDEVVVC